ncbi:translin-associated protein X [Iris pallida]|uniref:Translin-associated protein X n=1 Tax=Iris pallida TaxID=29817 RepID=A0AAX6IGG1_IRIPA|nr:translin-associated protein X [Iris pallida]
MTLRLVLLDSSSSTYAAVNCQKRVSLSIFILRMAAKPNPHHRPFHQTAAAASAAAVSSGKKPRTMMTTATATSGDPSSNSPMKEEFAKYANYLNEINDKRERVVKASRDVTINSKKVIFQVHRISKDNKEEVLMKAEQDLVAVTNQYMSKLVNELKGTDFWKLRRAYTPAVQEYVEAATLCTFCKTGTLLNLDEMNATLQPLSGKFAEPLQINVLDYLLGLADLTGELMRLAIGRISDGEIEYAQKICRFVRDIYRELTLLVPIMDDNAEMKKKMEVMLQSVVKIENACFSVHVRGSEYIPLLGSGDPDYSFLGVSDF